jgi:hypothetical protein
MIRRVCRVVARQTDVSLSSSVVPATTQRQNYVAHGESSPAAMRRYDLHSNDDAGNGI